MTDTSQSIEQAALAWLVRVNDPDFEAWDEWQAWLARNPAHETTYWRLAAREAEAVEALTARPVVANDDRPVGRSGRRGANRIWAAVAATLAVVVLGAGAYGWTVRPQPWLVETAPGEQRTLDLADGTRIQIAGDSRLKLDRRDPRVADLQSGRALFEVVHDDRRPFAVTVGDIAVTDLGTVFDVTALEDGGARVAVSEGLVRLDRNHQTVTLKPGDAVVANARGFERRLVAVETVAAWREGRLVYDNERLSVVAADLSRALGKPVVIAPELADRRISGSLSTRGSPEALRRRLELLLDATVVQSDAGWRITGARLR